VFAVAGITGSYIGYKSWEGGKESRRQINTERAETQKVELKV